MEVNALTDFNEKFFAASKKKIALVDLAQLKEQDINARKASIAVRDRMVKNIKQSGGLESVPYCSLREDGIFWLISGHNRVRAAAEAGQKQILVLYSEGLSLKEERAKQIAHNALEGTDEESILRQMAKELDDIQLQLESGMDLILKGDDADKVQNVMVDISANVESVTAYTLIFTDPQNKRFEQAVKEIERSIENHPGYAGAFLEHSEGLNKFRESCYQISKNLKIRNMPMVVTAMAELALKQLEASAPANGAERKSA